MDKEHRGDRSDKENQKQCPPPQDINHQQLDCNRNKNLEQQQEQKQTTNKEETAGKMAIKEHSIDTYL